MLRLGSERVISEADINGIQRTKYCTVGHETETVGIKRVTLRTQLVRVQLDRWVIGLAKHVLHEQQRAKVSRDETVVAKSNRKLLVYTIFCTVIVRVVVGKA